MSTNAIKFVGQWPMEGWDTELWRHCRKLTKRLRCYGCTLRWDPGEVFSYPVKEEHNTWTVRTICHHRACVKRYMLEHPCLRPAYMNELHRMNKVVYKDPKQLVAAPPFESLKVYGGFFSRERFKHILDQGGIFVKLTLPHLIPYCCPKEEIIELVRGRGCPYTDEQLQRAWKHVFVVPHPLNSVPPSFWHNNKEGHWCWHHKRPFQGEVYSYPVKRISATEWNVRGIFCSLSCEWRYILDHPRLSFSDFTTLHSLMLIEVYGIASGTVLPAFRYERLDDFLGDIPLAHFETGLAKPKRKSGVLFHMDPLVISSELVKGHPDFPIVHWCLTAYRERKTLMSEDTAHATKTSLKRRGAQKGNKARKMRKTSEPTRTTLLQFFKPKKMQ